MNTLKAAVWVTAIIGLTPAVLLAAINLISYMTGIRHLQKNGNTNATENSFASYLHSVEFGGKYHMEVSISVWPSVFLLGGAVTFLAGLAYLIPPQMQIRRVGGFEKLEQHIESLLKHRSSTAYLVISLIDDEYTAISLSKEAEGLSIEFFLTRKKQIAPVISFFEQRSVNPSRDTVTEEGTPFETRILSFVVSASSAEMAQLCKAIFTDTYQASDDTQLLFTRGK